MTTGLLSFIRYATVLLFFLATGLGAQPFTLSTQMLREGKPPGGGACRPAWARVSPRAMSAMCLLQEVHPRRRKGAL